jgi:hypothetical protein
LFSSSSASASEAVTVVSIRTMRATMCAIRGLCPVFWK